MELSQISFETLVSFHKQEGQEELAYLTILFTVIVGIIGYLGTAQKIDKSARILIFFFYIGLHLSMVGAFLDSMKIHSALHLEISCYVQQHPDAFIDGEDSLLYQALESLEKHDTKKMAFGGYALLCFMTLCVLSVGENSILSWSWIEHKLSRGSKKET